jgi:hypothetical protein
VGSDGHLFNQIMVLDGEVPPRRFRGQFKETGPNYFRGITEGNGHPPGDKLWVAYSMNKEDIWVTKARVPLTSAETTPLHENFEAADALERWNLHLPQWAPTQIATETGTSNHVLELRDEEPYDYALAERLFPASPTVHIGFRVQIRQATLGGTFEIEVQSQRHERPMRLRLNHSYLAFDRGERTNKQIRLSPQRWYAIGLDFNCEKQTYTLSVDGQVVQADIAFAEKMMAPERIVFRTGPWRGQPRPDEVDGKFDKPGRAQPRGSARRRPARGGERFLDRRPDHEVSPVTRREMKSTGQHRFHWSCCLAHPGDRAALRRARRPDEPVRYVARSNRTRRTTAACAGRSEQKAAGVSRQPRASRTRRGLGWTYNQAPCSPTARALLDRVSQLSEGLEPRPVAHDAHVVHRRHQLG